MPDLTGRIEEKKWDFWKSNKQGIPGAFALYELKRITLCAHDKSRYLFLIFLLSK